jgi:hypothetical protein
MTTLDELTQQIEKHANISSLLGVSVMLRPADAFSLVEWIKVLQAERNVLRAELEYVRKSVEDTDVGIEPMSGNETHRLWLRISDTLDKLYAHTEQPCVYPTRQE